MKERNEDLLIVDIFYVSCTDDLIWKEVSVNEYLDQLKNFQTINEK